MFRQNVPDSFEMHWSNLDHVAQLLALQDAIATPTSHASDVQQLRAVNHVVIFAPGYAHAVRLDLKA